MQTKVTNEQLGNVYLRTDGLDKELFLKLTEGMDFYHKPENNLYGEVIENCHGEWIGSRFNELESESREITIVELQTLLFPDKPIPLTEEVIRNSGLKQPKLHELILELTNTAEELGLKAIVSFENI